MELLEYLLNQPPSVSVILGTALFAGLFFLTRAASSLSRLVFASILIEIAVVTLHYSSLFMDILIIKDVVFQAVNFAMFLLWLAHFADRSTFRVTPTPLNGAVFVFFWLGILGAFAAPRPFWYYAAEWAVRFAAAVLFFYLIVTFLDTRRRWDIALHTYVAMVPITSIYAILQMQGLGAERWGQVLKDATFGNKDFFASFLTYTTPVALCLGVGARRAAGAAGYGLMALLGLYNIWVGETRGAWLGMMVFFVLLAWFECRFGRLREWVAGRRKLLVGVGLAALLAVFLSLAVMSAHRRATLQSIFQVREGTNIIRVYMWWGAARMLWDNPWFGQGLGTSYVTFPFFRPDRYRRVGMAPSTDYVHSEPMQFLCEQGILGFSGWMALLVVFLTMAYRRLQRMEDVADRYALFGLAGGFAGAVIHDSLNVNLRYTTSMLAFWGSMGLAARLVIGFEPEIRKQTMQEIRRRAEAVTAAGHALRHFVIVPAALAAFAFMVYCQFRVLQGNWLFKKAMLGGNRAIASIPLGTKALQSNPYCPPGAYALANAYNSAQDSAAAIVAYRTTMRLAPNYSHVHHNNAVNFMNLHLATNQMKYLYEAGLEYEATAAMNNDLEPRTNAVRLYRVFMRNDARALHHNQFKYWLSLEDAHFSHSLFWRGWSWGYGKYPDLIHYQYLFAAYLQSGETALQDYWIHRAEFVQKNGRPVEDVRYTIKMAAGFMPQRLDILQPILGGLAGMAEPETDLLYLIRILESLRPEHLPPSLCQGIGDKLAQASKNRVDSPLLDYAMGVLAHRMGARDASAMFFTLAREKAGDRYGRIMRGIGKYD
ncbi:MAG: hypothetical protein A3G34_13360 [Candidatus Lindowbacteria bacterium RIFCSPLOWO2_12_FULL_62_27]|nr:MAG: hypothetical protein A3I06_11100 [Candidatus Lindowbacteria bacterium RIFCSPLOWO2_02_FULL_62_12]OGH62571.1 MAG: hypothetical protein A3G34_13360 [Candidatus Lindowbacteria bacterium RIFCSPLOWO2_12_FULL_62_27]